MMSFEEEEEEEEAKVTFVTWRGDTERGGPFPSFKGTG